VTSQKATMTESTVSERLFEQFCTENSIRFVRIEEEQYQTQDYDVYFSCHRVVAEVKQIDPNDDDLELSKQLHSHGIASAWDETERRVLLKINSARKQLKSGSRGRFPTVLVLYDNVPTKPIDTEDIKTAMYGHETVRYSLSDNPIDSPPTKTSVGFGSNRRFTPEHNTTFSAVALLHRFGDGTSLLSVFHNIYAKKPIRPSWLRRDRVKQFTLGPTQAGFFQEWVEV